MAYLPRQIKALIDALREQLSAIEKAIQEHKRVIRDESETANEHWREIPRVISSSVRSAENEANYEHARREKEYQLQRKIMWVTLGAFAAAAIYAGVAVWQGVLMHRTYREIQKQTCAAQQAASAAQKAAEVADSSFRLSKRHTEDSDEAIVNVRGETVGDGSSIYRVTIVNNGKASAHSVTARIEISQRILPSDAKERTFTVFDISQDELRINDPIVKDMVLNGFGPPDWVRIHALRESIRIEGRLSYENGFDDHRSPTFCQELVTQPNPPGSTPPSMNVLIDCARLPSFLPPLYKRLQEMDAR